jgi:ribosomal protein L11 methyltransferase
MPFLRVDIDVDAAAVAICEELCLSLGAVSVTLVDQRDDPVLEPAPGEIRLWPATCLQALFAANESGQLPDTDALLARLQQGSGLEVQQVSAQIVADRVWEREWLRDFRPMNFGARLWIVPGELPLPTEAMANDTAIVRLDPGLAFGTGTHPTTAMCLSWLDRPALTGRSVVDYGCGSGILAIAALVLGASAAQTFDIDPQALLATDENATRNGVRERLKIVNTADQLSVSDVVLANILAGPLAELAENLSALVRPGGNLLLAGLLAHQADELITRYRPWISLREQARQGDWVLLAGQRPGDVAQFRP